MAGRHGHHNAIVVREIAKLNLHYPVLTEADEEELAIARVKLERED